MPKLLASFKLIKPGVNCPGVNCPGVNRPGVNCPGVNRPGVYCPGVNCPGVNCPGVNCPGVNRPGVYCPGVNCPGVNCPPPLITTGRSTTRPCRRCKKHLGGFWNNDFQKNIFTIVVRTSFFVDQTFWHVCEFLTKCVSCCFTSNFTCWSEFC